MIRVSIGHWRRHRSEVLIGMVRLELGIQCRDPSMDDRVADDPRHPLGQQCHKSGAVGREAKEVFMSSLICLFTYQGVTRVLCEF